MTTWTALSILVVLVVTNQVVMRSRTLWRRPGVFWANVAAQAGVAVGVAVAGFPGASATPLVRWLVVALFAMHVAQDVMVRNTRLAEERDAADPRSPLG